MKQVNFQFHAKKSEIMGYLFDMANNNFLTIIGVNIFPQFSSQIISSDDDIENVKLYELVILSRNEEIIKSDDYNSFMKAQKGNLIISFGRDNDVELQESSMGVISDDEIDILWKDCIKNWKKKCLKGAWVINPNNNLKSYYKNHRYTKAAKEAFDKGVKITPVAGNCLYELKEE